MEKLNESNSSTDTDILLKTPNNLFYCNNENDIQRSYFTNEASFINEIDNFIKVNQQKDAPLNSTGNELLSYANFSDSLHQQQESHLEQDSDLNLQLLALFQKKVNHCHQKISYLTKTSMEKDELVRKLKANEGLDEENSALKNKVKLLEEEISETIGLIKKFQEKNEILELKIENLTITSQEMSDIAKNQIKDLQTRLSNSAKIEKDLQMEVIEVKDNYKEEKENVHTERSLRSKLEREISDLKAQLKNVKEEKVKIRERFEESRVAVDTKQKKIFSTLMNEFVEKERKLVKEFDVQRASLKNYYQAQLESALEDKVKEFQCQLNIFQHELRIEAEDRERLCNDRVMNQMEMIVRKNEEEIDLMKRKCSEEVDLYRVQLINATKTIESLETKLIDYQSKRHNVASTLHDIMETQWKKIVDVLTCPSMESNHEISETDNSKQNNYEPVAMMMMNNLSKSEENLKSELLRNYVEKVNDLNNHAH